MRPSRLADPFIEVPMEEKTSDFVHCVSSVPVRWGQIRGWDRRGKRRGGGRRGREAAYGIINNMLIARVVVYVYCYASEGGYF